DTMKLGAQVAKLGIAAVLKTASRKGAQVRILPWASCPRGRAHAVKDWKAGRLRGAADRDFRYARLHDARDQPRGQRPVGGEAGRALPCHERPQFGGKLATDAGAPQDRKSV